MAGGTTYYFGVVDGDKSSGWLVTPDGQMDTARSGPWGNGYVPEGEYTFWDMKETTEDSMRPEGSKKKGIKIRLAAKGVTKLDEDNLPWIPDPNHPEGRTRVLIHFDGPSKDEKDPTYVGKTGDGTYGCVGFDNFAQTSQSLRNAYANGDKNFVIKHFKTKEEAQRAAEEYQRQMQQKRDKAPSRTKKGAKVTEGEKSVLLGNEQRCAAHETCPVDDGSKIVGHSPSIYVGKNQFAMSGVDDVTSNSSEVATGVDSIYMV